MTRKAQKTQAEDGTDLRSRRQDILAAAGAVFFERGFEAATTLEIARRARTSKSTLYQLFGSKEQLLSALIRESSQRMQGPLELPSPDSQAVLLDALGRFGHRFLEQLFHPHRTAMYRLAIAEAFRSGKVAKELEASGRQPVVEAVTRYLAQAARNQIVRPQDIELVVSAFFGILVGPRHTQLLLGLEKAVPPQAIRHRVDLAVEAVRRLVKVG
jgi:AcrR family transcriptional regulator